MHEFMTAVLGGHDVLPPQQPVQRFDSALNLNVHFHILFLDGVYLAAACGDELGTGPEQHEAELPLGVRPGPAEFSRRSGGLAWPLYLSGKRCRR